MLITIQRRIEPEGSAVIIEYRADLSRRINAVIEHTTASNEAIITAMPIGTKKEAPNQSLSGWFNIIPIMIPTKITINGTTILNNENSENGFRSIGFIFGNFVIMYFLILHY